MTFEESASIYSSCISSASVKKVVGKIASNSIQCFLDVLCCFKDLVDSIMLQYGKLLSLSLLENIVSVEIKAGDVITDYCQKYLYFAIINCDSFTVFSHLYTFLPPIEYLRNLNCQRFIFINEINLK